MSLVDRDGREIAPDTGNGVTPITAKQFAKYMAMQATVGETHEIAKAYAIDAMEHFARQVPDLVARMIVDFARAQGWEVKPPPQEPMQEPPLGAELPEMVSEMQGPPTDEVPPVTFSETIQ